MKRVFYRNKNYVPFKRKPNSSRRQNTAVLKKIDKKTYLRYYFSKYRPMEFLKTLANIRWTFRAWRKKLKRCYSPGRFLFRMKVYRVYKVPRRMWRRALAVRWVVKKKIWTKIKNIFKRTARPYPRRWWKKKRKKWSWVLSSLWMVKRKGRIVGKKRYRRMFVWAMRKRTNYFRRWRNFTFFFKRQLRVKKRRRGWKRLILRLKNLHKTKIYFKWFLIKRYRLRKIAPLKALVIKAKKLQGNKIMNFFFFLELQLGIICVRMHFFWRLYKARAWIQRGCVYVNGAVIQKIIHRLKIQDLLSLALGRRIWRRYFSISRRSKKKHMQKYRAFNCCELSLFCLAGILYMLPYKFKNIKYRIRRKRKIWIRVRAFTFLMNSFK